MNKNIPQRERYADILSDSGFKAVFGDPTNKQILIKFLNMLLAGERVIVDLIYPNVEIEPETKGKKSIRLDLFCRDQSNVWFVVEMQKVNHSEYFFKRTVYYGARALSLQMKMGQTDYNYMPVYVIGLMESGLHELSFFDRSQRDEQVICRYDFIERTKLIRAVPTISIIFVQFGNFTKAAQECTTWEDQCLYVIKHSKMLMDIPFSTECEDIQDLLYACEVANFNETKRITYDNDKMSEIDYRFEMASERHAGHAEGHAEGLAEGRAEGLAEGLAEGRAEGQAESRLEVARKMLSKGLDVKDIAEFTDLTVEAIEKLKSE